MPVKTPLVKVTFTLEPDQLRVLRELADEHYRGNVSSVVRDLIDRHPVTKSKLASSPLAT